MKKNLVLLFLAIMNALWGLSQAGSFDNSFGGTGRITIPVGNYDDRARAVAIQPDGKIIVVGESGLSVNDNTFYGNYNFSVCRLNPDGTLDNSFDGDGKLLIPTGDFSGIGTSVAIQPDGKVLVAGRGFFNATAEDFTVVRLNPNGSLDNSFDGDGISATPIGFTDDACYSIALQQDGKIVLAGQSYSDDLNFFGYGYSVIRLNSNGTLDNGFDNDGKKFIEVNNSLNSASFDVAIQGDGKIVLAGVSTNNASPSIWYTSVVRLLPDGSFDNGFDGDGQLTLITQGRSECNAVALQPDGKILLAGMERDPVTQNGGFSIIRLMPTGLPDMSFGTNGKVVAFLGEETDRAMDIVSQADGKIIAVGSWDNGKGNLFAAIRLTSAGLLDNSFDGDGKLMTNFTDQGQSVALQSNGKIVVASNDLHVVISRRDPSVNFIIYRLNGDACADGDGDGYDACSGDCDDINPNVHPGAPEICNGIDDNCNGQVDEGLLSTFYFDADGDGFGNPNNATQACTAPLGYVTNNSDCDDTKFLYADNDGDGFGSGPRIGCGVPDNTDCNDGNPGIHAPIDYYHDADQDGFGNANAPVTVCQLSPPAGYVSNNTDCDDTKTLYTDGDGDGYGAGSPAACGVANNADCNDDSPLIHPGALEDACNGIDNNCDGQIDEGIPRFTYYLDKDGDGWGVASQTVQACAFPAGYAVNPGDCDDNNPAFHPGATEVCNGIDDDCDGEIDDGAAQPYYRDSDEDGYGTTLDFVLSCTQPLGYVASNTDCNDNNPDIHPAVTELCNGVDDNCDGRIDEGLTLSTFYRDMDADGYGVTSNQVQACTAPNGYISLPGDCNDNDSNVNPGATEICNGRDDNCDGKIDEGLLVTYYVDNDRDGYGNPDGGLVACIQPAGYVTIGGDCVDTDASIHPGAAEICNLKDDNCDGLIDEGFIEATYYKDDDGDGYGDKNNSLEACTQPPGYVANSSDCDDTNDTIHPNATEYCNGIDEDCNGVVDDNPVLVTWYRDADGDGWGNPNQTAQACSPPAGYIRESFDCDDSNANIHPGATESDNDIDDNCNGKVDEDLMGTFYHDADNDGFGDAANSIQASTLLAGYVANNTDCNDNDSAIHPGATELCNGIDDDCDGSVDEESNRTFYRDADNDGFGNPNQTIQACTAPAGYVTNDLDCDDTRVLYSDNDGDGYGSGAPAPCGVTTNTDCNDGNSAIHPGAVEMCNNIDDNCNGQIDEGVKLTFYRDADNDGFGSPNQTILACTVPAGYVTNNTDCDDTRLLYADTDNDGFGAGSPVACGVVSNTDCNDNNSLINPNTIWYLDADNDNYYTGNGLTQCVPPGTGYKTSGLVAGGDCNDNDANINPDRPEVCGNNLDENCNGQIDEVCATDPAISINDITVSEADGLANLTVSLSKTSTRSIRISYTTVDGTAVSKGHGRNRAIDFVDVKGALNIPAGALSAIISVPIINDGISETTENFSVQLSITRAMPATIAKGTGIVTILDGNGSVLTVSSKVRAIPREANFSVRVSPNPSDEQFVLHIESNSMEPTSVRIIDVQGRTVKQLRSASTNVRFGSELKQGFYIVEVQQGTNKETVKVIKL